MPVRAEPPVDEGLDSKDTTAKDKDATKDNEETTAKDNDVTKDSKDAKTQDKDATVEKQKDEVNGTDKKSKPSSKTVIEEVRPSIYGYTSEYWLPKISLNKFDEFLKKHNRTLIMFTSSAPGRLCHTLLFDFTEISNSRAKCQVN